VLKVGSNNGKTMSISLEAEIGIRRLHALCADAVWRKDGTAFSECYTDDAVWKIAGFVFHGREAISKALGQLGIENERVLMTFGAPIIHMGDGLLTGRTYAVEHVKRLDGSASTSIGIYYEQFIQQDAVWLFKWRHFDFCYLGPTDLSEPLYPFQDYGAPPAMPASDDRTAGLYLS
jgi:hypothetical protein